MLSSELCMNHFSMVKYEDFNFSPKMGHMRVLSSDENVLVLYVIMTALQLAKAKTTLMAKRKTTTTPLLMQWSYCNLTLSYWHVNVILRHRNTCFNSCSYISMSLFFIYLRMKYIDGIMEERCSSIANALELHLYCTNPSIHFMIGVHQYVHVICNKQMYIMTVSQLNVMMNSSNRNIFHVTGPLCGELTSCQWIPCTKASDAELWCFLWSVPK